MRVTSSWKIKLKSNIEKYSITQLVTVLLKSTRGDVRSESNLGDSHGQMGISNKKQNRAYITPKIYSFNINLRQASCGD